MLLVAFCFNFQELKLLFVQSIMLLNVYVEQDILNVSQELSKSFLQIVIIIVGQNFQNNQLQISRKSPKIWNKSYLKNYLNLSKNNGRGNLTWDCFHAFLDFWIQIFGNLFDLQTPPRTKHNLSPTQITHKHQISSLLNLLVISKHLVCDFRKLQLI